MRSIIAAVLCLTAVSATPIPHHNIHKRMTPGEVYAVFGTTHADVPDYKLVNIEISRVQKRSVTDSELSVDISGEHVPFLLVPTNGFLVSKSTPVFEIERKSSGLEFRTVVNVMKEIGEFMEARQSHSIFVISKSRSQRDVVNGFIGTRNLVIRSIPERLRHSLSSNGTNYHFAYDWKIPSTLDQRNRRSRDAESDLYALGGNYLSRSFHHPVPFGRSPSEYRKPRNHSFPVTIYPRIIVAVDSSSYADHQNDIDTLVIYHLLLWHAVSVRYESFVEPKVRLNIACFVISTNVEASPFIEDADVGNGRINPVVALNSAATFWGSVKRTVSLPPFHVVMIFTAKPLVVMEKQSDSTTYETNGASFFHSICYGHKNSPSFDAVGIITDRGSLDALVVSQVLATIFGIDDDSEDVPESCPASDNYVMAVHTPYDPDVQTRLNNWHFSRCSKEQLRMNFQTYDHTCVYDKPKSKGEVLPEIVLFTGLRLKDVCPQMFGPGVISCEYGALKKEDICTAVHCRRILGECVKTNRSPPDGTRCGRNGEYCESGKCISP